MNNAIGSGATDSMYAQNSITRQSLFNEETGEISSEAVQYFNQVLTKITDERIERRLLQEDIAKVYTAKVEGSDIGEIAYYYVTSTTDSDGVTTYKLSHTNYIGVRSITVTFDDPDKDKKYTITLSGSLVNSLPVTNISVDRKTGTISARTCNYVKVCTYDGITFHLLHDL